VRVAIVNKYARVTGGADQHVIGLAAALRKRGHEVRVLTTASDENVERDGPVVPLTVTNASRGELGGYRRIGVAARAMWNRAAATQMRRLIEDFSPDVVHVHKLYPQLSVAPVVVASRRGVPIVQTLHDLELVAANPVAARAGWRDRTEERVDYRALNTATFAMRRLVQRPRVDRFVAPSRFIADLHRQHGIDAEVIPNFTEFSGMPTPAYDDRRGLLFVGRLTAHKGIADVLDVARLLPDHDVTIAGFGPLEQRVRDELERLPNASYVGAVDRERLVDLLGAARVVLMPSAFPEIGPLTAIEAMAFGTPVVAYDHSGLAEYVRGAGGGSVVSPSAEALAREAAAIHDHRERWRELSASGAAGVESRHSPASYARQVSAVYLQAANGEA
jgi:glycosyltransferase involved in cell wall biosynthesis